MRTIHFADHVASELARASYRLPRRWLRISTGVLSLAALLTLLLVMFMETKSWLSFLTGGLALLSACGLVYYEGQYRRQAGKRAQLAAGLTGQRLVPDMLAHLPDDYYLISNLALPGRADDIDHMVVGPNGIFALEAKHHRGRIFVRDGQWYQAKKSRKGRLQPEVPRRDPVAQLKRNVDYLRTCINHTDRALGRRTALWIEGAVVFTHPHVELDIPKQVTKSLAFPVLKAQDLADYITGFVPRRPYSKNQIRQIVSLLGHLQAPSSHR